MTKIGVYLLNTGVTRDGGWAWELLLTFARDFPQEGVVSERENLEKPATVFEPNVQIVSVLDAIHFWVWHLSWILVLTGLCTFLFGAVTLVGLRVSGVPLNGLTLVQAMVPLLAALLQLSLGYLAHRYSAALERYLRTGNPMRLLHVLTRQKHVCMMMTSVGALALTLFVMMFLAVFQQMWG